MQPLCVLEYLHKAGERSRVEACELGALTLPDQVDALIDAARAILQEISTLTPPNEWVSVEDDGGENNRSI